MFGVSAVAVLPYPTGISMLLLSVLVTATAF